MRLSRSFLKRAFIPLVFLLGGYPLFGEKLLFVTNDYPPYVDSRAEGGGTMTRRIRRAAEDLGWEIEIVFYPWARCEAMVRHGEAFAAFPYTKNEKRGRYAYFSNVLDTSRMLFFYYAGDSRPGPPLTEWSSLEDLKPLTVGAVLGYWYIDEFKQAGLRLNRLPDLETGLRRLRQGRIDLLPVDERVARYRVRRLYPGEKRDFRPLGKPLSEERLRLMVSQDYPNSGQLLTEFNRALAEGAGKP